MAALLTYQETEPGRVRLKLSGGTADTVYDFRRQTNASGYVLFRRLTTDATGFVEFFDVSATRYLGSYLYQTEPEVGGTVTQGQSEVPENPSAVQGTAASSSQIDLTWQDCSNNEDRFESQYTVGGGSGWTNGPNFDADTEAGSITGLEPNTLYFVRMRAVNSRGASEWVLGNEGIRTDNAAGGPSIPTNFAGVSSQAEEVTLTWDHDGVDVDAFEIRYAPASDPENSIITGTNGTARSLTIQALPPDVSFIFIIRAFRLPNIASDWAGPVNVRTGFLGAGETDPPGPPFAPTLLAGALFSVQIQWVDVQRNITRYVIERSRDNTNFFVVGTAPGTTRRFTDRTTQPATTYYYRVRARNGNGQSNPSGTLQTTSAAFLANDPDPGGPRTSTGNIETFRRTVTNGNDDITLLAADGDYIIVGAVLVSEDHTSGPTISLRLANNILCRTNEDGVGTVSNVIVRNGQSLTITEDGAGSGSGPARYAVTVVKL